MIDHWQARQGIITMQSAQCGANPIARIGDSITEQMWMGMPATLPGSNSSKVLNGGFMGIGVGALDPYRAYVMSLCNPWAVSFQVGTNDAIAGTPFDPAAWEAAFEAHVVAILTQAGVSKTIVKTVPPVLNSTCGYDQSRINWMNQAITNVCARHPGVTLLNLDPYLKCVSTGYARPGYLLDSVHLAGNAAWTVAWLEYCILNNQALAAPPQPC